ncbi:MAG: HIT domain-containing protein [Pyrinomonadaceae bacterium]
MDVLWSPWRYDYITSSGPAEKTGCVFCDILKNSAPDEENFILKRAEFNFVILNIYPYTSGHLMVIPYEHLSTLDKASKQVSDEFMDLTKAAQAAISEVYTPDGINLGMNIGKAAGAGVDGHIHMHVLPRWVGDVNFMTAIGQTRTIPETLTASHEKLKAKF